MARAGIFVGFSESVEASRTKASLPLNEHPIYWPTPDRVGLPFVLIPDFLRSRQFYLRVTADGFRLKDLRTKKTLSSRPCLCVNDENIIVSIGEPACRKANTMLYALCEDSPFLNDKVVASKIAGHLIRELFKGRWFIPSSVLLVQLDFKRLNKLNDELKADWEEIGEGCGARKTIVMLGRKLSDARAIELAVW